MSILFLAAIIYNHDVEISLTTTSWVFLMIMRLWIAFENEESRLHKVITCNALRTWRHMPNYKVWKYNLCTPLFTAKAVCLQSQFHTSLYLSLFTSLQFQHFAFASVSLGWQSLLSHSPSSHLCLALSLSHKLGIPVVSYSAMCKEVQNTVQCCHWIWICGIWTYIFRIVKSTLGLVRQIIVEAL